MENVENPMGVRPIRSLVIRTGLPLMLSLLINSLYNFVDSVFVSRLSEDALTALSLAAPMQTLMGALGCGIAVGLNAVISRALGAGDREGVKNGASAAMFLALCAGALLAIIGAVAVKPYYAWQSAGDAEIAAYGESYLLVCMLLSVFQMGQWVFDRLVIASGRSSLFLITLSAASVTNLILDPIFIFGYLGLPAMGTTGAAVATVIGQAVGCLAGFLINRRFNREIPLHFTLKPKLESVAAIIKIGAPTTLVQGLSSLVGVAMNSILIGFSSTAVAIYGVCIKLQSLATTPPHGINNGVIPLVAYNYGACKPDRIRATIKWALIYSLALFAVILLSIELFPAQVLALFDASAEMLAAGVPALRIMALAWLLAIPSMLFAAGFQGLGRGTHSMALTMVRTAALPLLFALVAKAAGSLNLVWWAFVLSEALALPLGALMWRRLDGRVVEAIAA